MEFKKEDLLLLYRNMLLARKTDEMMVNGIMLGKVPSFFHSGQGHEATAVGGVTFLRKSDWLICSHRGHGLMQSIAKGMSIAEIIGEHYCKTAGCCKGVSAGHLADMKVGNPGAAGTLGYSFTLAAGVGIALKKNGKGEVVVCYFGDGTAGRGTLHESFNMAAIMKLPVVWVCENNGYAIHTPLSVGTAKANIADLAYGYGMPGMVVDGQDVVAVAEAVMSAVERARAGEGPALIECKTYRFRPHSEGLDILDGAEKIPAEVIANWKKKDPIVLFRNKLLDLKILDKAEDDSIDKETTEAVAAAEKIAAQSPMPDPSTIMQKFYLYAE